MRDREKERKARTRRLIQEGAILEKALPQTTQMKHGHRSWSRRGGNHLAKILAKKCSGKLYEVTERLRRPVFEEEKAEELYGEILMSAKAPKKDGKGYEYPAMGHVVGLDGKIQGERKRLLHMAGY